MKRLALVIFAVGLGATALRAQPIGNTYVAGTTWYDYQHNGSCGRMIGLDDSGYVHIAWMNGLEPAITGPRHVYYNRWNASSSSFEFEGGQQVDSSTRAGYVTLAVTPDGCPIPAFHQINPSDPSAHTAVSLCLENISMPPWSYQYGSSIEIIWPIVALTDDSVVCVLSRENNRNGDPWDRLYYSRGVFRGDSNGIMSIVWQDYDNSGFGIADTIVAHSFTIAAARHSGRVARGWGKVIGWRVYYDNPLNYNNDLILQLSDDAGLLWRGSLNITNFTIPDTALHNQGGDWRICNRDTLRAFNDLGLLFDGNDALHAAFTVVPFYYWRNDTLGPFTTPGASLIYHWSEVTGQFSLVADGWIEFECGSWQTIVQRPSLAIDEDTGYLYCAYIRYDSAQVSTAGYPNADVWISVSTNGGSSWSVGTNVTRTTPTTLPAPPGESLSEREPTLAETVRGGFLHLSYVLDRDAGALPWDEGVATENDMIYQRIPVDSIPTTPILPNYPLHWDSAGFASSPPRARRGIPERFVLFPPYPNPFNSTTTVRFDLPRIMEGELTIYDVLGRRADVLIRGRLEAGSHSVLWKADRFASGVYFVRLRAENHSQFQKILLVR